jgi:cardiolipin synthase
MNLNLKDIFSLIFIAISVVCIIIIICDKRDPKGTLAWILTFIISRPIGILLYFLIGRNWRNKKFRNSADFFDKVMEKRYGLKLHDSKFKLIQHLLIKNDFSILFPNNSTEFFIDGENKFDSLKNELRKAKHHIHLEYYIVKSDKIGNEIKDILIEKAKSGIKVRFIIDRIGSISLSKKYIKDLRASGISVLFYSYIFNPFYRNHRKIVVIDGEVGFVGGMNIGDEYLGKGKLGFWRDLHIKIQGDLVLGLQCSFLHDFYMLTKPKEALISLEEELLLYFPLINNNNICPMQLVESGPGSKNPSIMQAMVKMIYSAKDHIYIMTPYFIPSESLMVALKTAALSGIDIKILFPGKYDHFYVYYASRSYLQDMAEYGIKVYFYKEDSFLHSKAISVDGEMCTLGNTNIDIRSFELNFEANVVIYDSNTTKELEKIFLEDLRQSKQVDKEYFQNTSYFMKFIESLMRIFSNAM